TGLHPAERRAVGYCESEESWFFFKWSSSIIELLVEPPLNNLYGAVMSTVQAKEKPIMVALGMGVAVPFLFFCLQVVAAPFYPGYSFFNRDASTLGSDGSSCPSIFNVGAIFVGIVTLIASWGFLRAFQRLGTNPILAWLTTLALISSGLASINAGIFPLPDPRHSGGLLALLGIGTFLL